MFLQARSQAGSGARAVASYPAHLVARSSAAGAARGALAGTTALSGRSTAMSWMAAFYGGRTFRDGLLLSARPSTFVLEAEPDSWVLSARRSRWVLSR